MTNTLALWLAALILGFLALDYFVLGWDVVIFLGRKLMELIEYIAFWR
ncbi:MAG: hypothetical protein QNJ16_03355 [Rhodobacter sp.]|nr:hypothetical protein [Rhodobacter sp.]